MVAAYAAHSMKLYIWRFGAFHRRSPNLKTVKLKFSGGAVAAPETPN